MRKTTLYLSVLSALIIFILALSGCGNATDNKFIVGFDASFPPMGFMAEDGEYKGFDLDVAKAVADKLDLEFVAQPIGWDSKDVELLTRNVDCIWNGFTTKGREEAYTWSKAYMKNSQVIVVNEDSNIKSEQDLAGKTVCVQKDSSGLAAIEDNSDFREKFGKLVQVDTYLNAFMELQSGAIDAIVMDEVVARYEIKNADLKFKIIDDTLGAEEYAVGFLLGNEELRDKVDNALKELKDDNTLSKISQKWFGEDIISFEN